MLKRIFLSVHHQAITSFYSTEHCNEAIGEDSAVVSPAHHSVNKANSTPTLLLTPSNLKRKPILVILLSSTPRSGSSLVAELLSTHPSSVLFFEPLQKLQKDRCINDTSCVIDYLKKLLLCQYDDDFQRWFLGKKMFSGFFSGSVLQCNSFNSTLRQTCLQKLDIRKECDNSSARITKVIRTKISFLVDLLQDNDIDLKIVHLFRDPRGFIKSISKFRWNKDPHFHCSRVLEDLQSYRLLKKIYPDKIYQLKYENIAMYPLLYAKQLFTHVFGIEELSEETIDYLVSHTKSNKKPTRDAMLRVRNSTATFQSWRETISSEMLRKIESTESCRQVIESIHHRFFNTVSNVRNKHLSLFL